MLPTGASAWRDYDPATDGDGMARATTVITSIINGEGSSNDKSVYGNCVWDPPSGAIITGAGSSPFTKISFKGEIKYRMVWDEVVVSDFVRPTESEPVGELTISGRLRWPTRADVFPEKDEFVILGGAGVDRTHTKSIPVNLS